MIKPKRLRRGDTIAVTALSWNGNEPFPHIVDKGIERLKEEFGFKIKRGKSLNYTNEEHYKNPKLRANELHELFKDREVKGIITIIGGDESIRVLPHINQQIVLDNPKFFMGYSDITTYNTYFNQLGLVTFNGPAVMAGFAESVELENDFVDYIKKFLFDDWCEFEYKPFKRFTNGYLDWSKPKNLEKENTGYQENTEQWKFLQGNKDIEGELYGGCMEVLEFMKGTDYWPSREFWRGKVLFFETSEEKPSPKEVKYWLRNYGMQGIFAKVSGILFGRPKDYTDDEKKELDSIILEIMEEFNCKDLLVITNMDFGHTDPQLIMPNGIRVRISPKEKSFKLIESVWKD